MEGAPVITIIGPIGSGKTLQAQKLAAALGWETFSTGQLLRDAGSAQSRAEMGTGKLVQTDYVQELVLKHIGTISSNKGVILDGSPRMLPEAERLDAELPEMNRKIGLVVFLVIDEPTVEERLMARGRADDRPDVIKVRWQQYADETMPVVERYRAQGIVRDVDGRGTPEEVAARIRMAVSDAKLV